MASISASPGRVSIPALVTGHGDTKYGAPDAPVPMLQPLLIQTFDLPEFRLRNGWPVEVPEHDVNVITSATATGAVVNTRVAASSVTTRASVRWVADSGFSGSSWSPIVGSGSFTSSSAYAPTLNPNYTYKIRDEIFTRTTVDFDSDSGQHMWANLSSIMGSQGHYMVMMVASVVEGHSTSPWCGLWAHGSATPAGQETFSETPANYYGVSLQGNYLWGYSEVVTDPQQAVSIAPELSTNTPCYIVFDFNRPQTSIYAGTPSNFRLRTVLTGTTNPPSLASTVLLGRDIGSVDNTVDMSLFEIGVYANPPADWINDISALAQVYGGA